jgi:hypothetical protein
MRTILLAALLCVGCGSDPTDTAPTDAGNDTATADSAAGGERTLASCTTSIADDAPEIYKRYFKCVTITTTADSVIVASESLPPHKSNYWGTSSANYAPFDTSRGAEYRANPNTLRAQTVKLTIPREPKAGGVTINATAVDGVVGTHMNEYSLGPVGVALDSVALFNPLAAPGDDIEDEKFTFDSYNAHPNDRGAYHYHTTTPGPLEVLAGKSEVAPELYGVMCDGTFVLGCNELDGAAPSGTLDPQGGHVSDLVDKNGTVLVAGRYHTHVCATGRKYTPEIQYYATCTR